MDIWNIVLFAIVSVYLFHCMIRNVLWNEEKELVHFKKKIEDGSWSYFLHNGLLPFFIGMLLTASGQALELGWLWFGFGVGLVIIGLNPITGIVVHKFTNEPSFNWEPLNKNEILEKVSNKRKSAAVFIALLIFWVYTGAKSVI